MPKQTKTTSKKKVVSSKGSRRVSTPVGLLIVLVAGLLLAIVGTYGFTKYTESDLKAKAASLKEIKPYQITKNGGDGVKYVACKAKMSSSNPLYAGKFDVTVVASKPKTLIYASTKNKQALLRTYFYYKKALSKDSVIGKAWPEGYYWESTFVYTTSSTWWDNAVTASKERSIDSTSRIMPVVHSDKSQLVQLQESGKPIGHNETYIDNLPSSYVVPPTSLFYNGNVAAYKKALNNWEQKTIEVAKLPNCN